MIGGWYSSYIDDGFGFGFYFLDVFYIGSFLIKFCVDRFILCH